MDKRMTQQTQVPEADLEGPITGTITGVKLDKGFAFAKDRDGREYFIHRTTCAVGVFEDLLDGDAVQFKYASTLKGLRAYAVERIV